MTISNSRNRYQTDQDPPPPKTVCIGVSLITVETYTIVQDDRAIELPVDDEVVYTSVPYEVAHSKNGCSDWNAIARELEKEGYLQKHWQIMSVWIPVENHIADEIF
ncbi:hypothetical protein C7B62_24415 [Pleurocapsa sp. CCALA 161]|uniref:hypothetical protein n=1 Tax=Pleurocapsa sp. CCALA 161 TaxID=2107688 RepID=UPI000D073C61|nr:hypothetical protein [Pleurocapsa sp. CCALA 161]PSB05792.1 hypothetical protein C7B62_24415 [Pleurocapsa sp. CCALA 161]